MKHLTKVKLILEALEKQVLKEDGYDSEEQKNIADNYPNYLESQFDDEVTMLCTKYSAKGLSPENMYAVLMGIAKSSMSLSNYN